jgi:hypothetical protein
MRRFASLLVALLWLVPALAAATQVEAMSLRDLVVASDRIVVATLVSTQSHYDDQDRIVTDLEWAVEESVRGPRASSVVVRHLGGAVGSVGLAVAGEEVPAVGTRSVLFLRRFVTRDAGEVMRPVGMSQGILPVVEGDGGELVMPGGAGIAIVSRSPGGTLVPASGALPAPVARDELLSRVRDLVREVHGE